MYENIFVMRKKKKKKNYKKKKKKKKKKTLKIAMDYSGQNRNLASILFQGVKNIFYVF